MDAPYTKTVIYEFEIDGEHFGIDRFDADSFSCEEMTKNGQEDTHMGGEAVLVGGVWKWDYESFSDYLGADAAASILAYVQKHGLPETAVTP